MDQDLRHELARAEDRHWWFEGRRRIIASVVRGHRAQSGQRGSDISRTGGRILEVGCGNGANLAMLSGFGTVTALEPDQDDRARAAARGIGTVRPGFLPDGLGDGLFDVVLALDVIEHVDQDVASLKAMASRLAPGGLLVVTVPANPWMWSEHDTRNGHFRRYTAGTLRRAFLEAGITPSRIAHFNTLLFPLVALVRVVGRLVGSGSTGTDVPPGPINLVLTQLMGFEARLLRLTNLPVGVSLLATYRAPA